MCVKERERKIIYKLVAAERERDNRKKNEFIFVFFVRDDGTVFETFSRE